jgi:DNA-directed RNA polymerase subunit K/omega
MDEVNEVLPPESPGVPEPPAPPIDSRFLFVDVAALRAKQLRRGATVRFNRDELTAAPLKPERVAMEEVRRGLVHYRVPDDHTRFDGEPSSTFGAAAAAGRDGS